MNLFIEIVLFYLLPNQRRWKEWFPDILHYHAPVEDIRKRIREIDNSQEDPEFLPFISEKLRKLTDMPKPDEKNKMDHENLKNDLKEIENKLNHNNHNNEQMFQTLLAEIKNLKK
ncbi:1943_t:CDS:2 [Entrophospora sp. SA101]|nr:1943_t:CDS:2 [Entrophospora sp. SA101]